MKNIATSTKIITFVILFNILFLAVTNVVYYKTIVTNKEFISKNDIETKFIKLNDKIKDNFVKSNFININTLIEEFMNNDFVSKIIFKYSTGLNQSIIETPANFLKPLWKQNNFYIKNRKNKEYYEIEMKYGKKLSFIDVKNSMTPIIVASIVYLLILILILLNINNSLKFLKKFKNKINKIDIENPTELYIDKNNGSSDIIQIFDKTNEIIKTLLNKNDEINNKNNLIKKMQKRMKIWFIEIDKNKNIINSFGIDDILPNRNTEIKTVEDLFTLIQNKKEKLTKLKEFKISVRNEEEINMDIEIFNNMIIKHLKIKGIYNFKNEIYTFTIEDKTNEINNKKEMFKLKNIDTLTNLYNFNNFEEHAIEIIKNNKKYAFISVHIKEIQMIEKIYNIIVAENIIRNINFKLRKIFDDNKNIFKYNDDTFFIVIEYNEDRELSNIFEDIQNIMNEPIETNNNVFFIEPNIGYYTFVFKNDNTIINKGIQNTNIALIEAIEKNKKIVEFNETIINKYINEFETIQELKKDLIDKENIFTLLQPKFNIKNNKIEAFEILFRWNKMNKHNIDVSNIIKIALKSNLINDLNVFILTETFNILKKWKNDDTFKHMKISFNLNVNTIDKELFRIIKNYQLANNVELEKLEIELSGVIDEESKKEILENIYKIKELGVSISIDNFATNISPILNLKIIPNDIIKIDKKFINDITINKDSLSIVENIINISKTKNIRIDINGIENNEQFDIIKNFNINFIQGYFISKPLELKELKNFITNFKGI